MDPTLPRTQMIDQIKMRLGGSMIDLELEQNDLDYAITSAIDRYRQRSGNSLEESFLFLEVEPEKSTYKLPAEVQEIRTVYRRNLGTGGAAVDPFSLAFTNNIYMIQNPGGLGGNGVGFLATYELATQFQSMIGRMFGRDLLFNFDATTHIITFHRKFQAVEQIALHIYNAKPENIILQDVYAKPWVRDYATAMAKLMIGEARSLYQSLGGPQGGVSMNGESMKNEAKEEMTRLEEEIKAMIDSNDPWPFLIG